MPRRRTRVVTSMPGQMRTRASKVSPSITRSTCAGWPARKPVPALAAAAGAATTGSGPARTGAISAPALKPAAKAAAASSSAPPCRGAGE